MKSSIHSANRVQSKFRTEAEKAFAFLVHDYGFRLIEDNGTFLRYEAPHGVFVNVYHGRSSYELKFELGRVPPTGAEEERFYPSDLVDVAGGTEESFFQASSVERVERYVPKLADLLARYGQDALKGDPFAFKRLRDVQRRKSDELLLSWNLADARAAADRAWHDKDYSRVVELLQRLARHLTPSEQKKLDYARSRVR